MFSRGIISILMNNISQQQLLSTIVKGNISNLSRYANLDPNFQNTDGCTALFIAVTRDNPECIENLYKIFSTAIDPNISNNDGITPLMRAMSNESSKCYKLLVKLFTQQIDPNIQTKSGHSVLSLAVWHRHSQYIPMLCRHFPSIDPNMTLPDGNTILMIAASNGDKQTIIALAEHFPKLEINAQNNLGNTALMRLFIQHHSSDHVATMDCITALSRIANSTLAHNSSFVNVQNHRGETALMLTIKHHHEHSIPTLYRCFPHIDHTVRDNQGNTAFMYVIQTSSSSPTLLLQFLSFYLFDFQLKQQQPSRSFMERFFGR